MIDPDKAFDFRAHEQAAVTAYLKCHRFYEDLASIVKRIFEETALVPFRVTQSSFYIYATFCIKKSS